jgi:Uncharacterized proteins of the AP superfamily
MKSKYLLLLSFDAVDKRDFEILKTLPNFSSLIKSGSYSNNVESVYPSLTYPAHTSIITGKLPKNHGIVNNILIQPNRFLSSDWFWERKHIKGTTLFDIAKSNGLKTAALLWPITGKAPIDYNIPEIFPNRSWQNQIIVSLLNGSKFFQYNMNKKFGHLRNGISQPSLDNFTLSSLIDLLETKAPEFTAVHFTDVDSQRHDYGYSSNEAYAALKRHDERLGKIINTLNKLNIFEETTLVALGDHSFLDAKYVIKINNLFLKHNLLELTSKNKIKHTVAYCNYCDGSAYIYLKDKSRHGEVYELLNKFSEENNDCIKKIYSNKDASNLGADPNCDFMLEAKQGYYFINDIDGEIIEEAKGKYHVATHGYSPKIQDYQTFFIAKGPDIREYYSIGFMSLLSEGPTLAKILGGNLDNPDGNVLNDIFRT